ncbi:MAG: sel1 repeat family protein [Burkholderiales bacterium]|nr:sel1 repeat family protein [Burkholderiales bacterium]
MPTNIQRAGSFEDLFEDLEKDSEGWPVFPISYDPFVDGDHNEMLITAIAALSAAKREALQALAVMQHLSELDRKKFAICKEAVAEYGSAIVLLTDARASLAFSGDIVADYFIGARLALDKPLYFIQYCDDLIDCVRLWLQGRLVAIRLLKGQFDYDTHLATTTGLYAYESDYGVPECSGESGICPLIKAPEVYKKAGTPDHALKKIPEAFLTTLRKENSNYSTDTKKLIQFLRGVRFAETNTIQIANSVNCYDWNMDFYDPKQISSVMRQIMAMAHQPASEARTAEIARWHSAAEQGDILAQYSLGYLYCESWEKDLRKAIHWFERAALQADATNSASEDMFENGSAAQYCYAELLQQNLAVEGQPDPNQITQMLMWYEKAAAKRQPHALYRLSDFYSEGKYVEKDLERHKQLIAQAFSVAEYTRPATE